jgi:hypothetical protein
MRIRIRNTLKGWKKQLIKICCAAHRYRIPQNKGRVTGIDNLENPESFKLPDLNQPFLWGSLFKKTESCDPVPAGKDADVRLYFSSPDLSAGTIACRLCSQVSSSPTDMLDRAHIW